jgi:hypothetical protein
MLRILLIVVGLGIIATILGAWTHGVATATQDCLEYQAGGCLLYNTGSTNKILVQ